MKKEDLKPDSLEKVLLEPFHNLKEAPLSIWKMIYFSSILKNSENRNVQAYKSMLEENHVVKDIKERIEKTLSITIDLKTQICISALTDENIDRSMVYLFYLQYWAKKNNKRHINFLKDFCLEIFEKGFPSNEDIDLLWQKQKVEGVNMIDIPYAQESIHFKTVDN